MSTARQNPDDQGLIQQLTETRASFSRAEQQVIDVLLADPHEAVSRSISWLASRARVSTPTVTRLSRKLGCSGMSDFRLRLAEELGRSSRLPSRSLTPGSSAAGITRSVIDSIERSLSFIQSPATVAAMQSAAESILAARRVAVIGQGASASVADDARHKLLRIGIMAAAYPDHIDQRMFCAAASPDDLVICISYSGATSALISSAQLAAIHDVPTLAITRADSRLAAACRWIIDAPSADDHDLYTPMTSRIVHLAIIDIVVSLVAARRSLIEASGDQEQTGLSLQNQVERIQQAVMLTRDY